ncbi:MAG TPA: hypothetical protein VMV29_14015 [Ktedonobacterales bacterium]|nr:hypothetical protein [Ktedonobacterales bacterium]
MNDHGDTSVCRIVIYVRDDALAQLLKALPLDFRIRQLPLHPDHPEGPGWQLNYRGVWTIEQDDTLASFDDAEVVTSWGRSGIPLRSTPNEE